MDSTWTTWAGEQPRLGGSTLAMLQRLLGPLTPADAAPIESAVVRPSALSQGALDRLREALGTDAVLVDDRSRAEHAGGQSYTDIVRRRRGDTSAAPDAVLLPADADAVQRALEVCSAERITVVPWGGGTSVVGGLDAVRGDGVALVALDLRRLDRLLEVDADSRTATFQARLNAPSGGPPPGYR